MCSRFELSSTARACAARFGLKIPPPWPNRAEVRPTDLALTIGAGEGRLLRWGLEVAWDKRPLINARAETLAERAAFRRLLGRRVLVPATAWWEWRLGADGKSRTKYRLGRGDGDLFALAGLYDGDRLVVVTCAPAPSIAHVHDRMPVLLPAEAEAAWADPAVPFAQVAAALTPYAGELDAVPESAPAPPKPMPAQGELF
jgi:putative SOS response-associated peptidase YedK